MSNLYSGLWQCWCHSVPFLPSCRAAAWVPASSLYPTPPQFLPPLSEGAMKQLDALAAADALEDKVMGFFGKLEELGPVGDFVPGEGGVKFNWDPATVA